MATGADNLGEAKMKTTKFGTKKGQRRGQYKGHHLYKSMPKPDDDLLKSLGYFSERGLPQHTSFSIASKIRREDPFARKNRTHAQVLNAVRKNESKAIREHVAVRFGKDVATYFMHCRRMYNQDFKMAGVLKASTLRQFAEEYEDSKPLLTTTTSLDTPPLVSARRDARSAASSDSYVPSIADEIEAPVSVKLEAIEKFEPDHVDAIEHQVHEANELPAAVSASYPSSDVVLQPTPELQGFDPNSVATWVNNDMNWPVGHFANPPHSPDSPPSSPEDYVYYTSPYTYQPYELYPQYHKNESYHEYICQSQPEQFMQYQPYQYLPLESQHIFDEPQQCYQHQALPYILDPTYTMETFGNFIPGQHSFDTYQSCNCFECGEHVAEQLMATNDQYDLKSGQGIAPDHALEQIHQSEQEEDSVQEDGTDEDDEFEQYYDFDFDQKTTIKQEAIY